MAHGHLEYVLENKKGFVLKTDHDEVVKTVYSLEELRDALYEIPADAVSFHLDDRNDFESWIKDVIGSNALAKAVGEVEHNGDPFETKEALLNVLNYTIKLLHEEPKQK